jgi:uroporphyrinogen decarboxylase
MGGRAETVMRSLDHLDLLSLPRGELFLGRDFLDRWFGEARGGYGEQLGRAAEALGLSLVGADLDNGEAWHAAESWGTYKKPEDCFLVGCMNGPVSRLVASCGFLSAMASVHRDRSLFSDGAERLLKEAEQKIAFARARGFGAAAITDDIAGNRGLFFPYDFFLSTVWPVYRQLAALIKGKGLRAFFHSDGDTRRIIEPLILAGYECIHPVDAQAGINVYDLRKEFGQRVSFMGHIDIMAWPEEKIRAEIGLAETACLDGGLILGSTCGISMKTAGSGLRTLYPGKRGGAWP